MTAVSAIAVGLLDGHLLSDAALRRVAAGASSVVALTSAGDGSGLAGRWASVAPGIELTDGGTVGDVRDAIVACAERRILVLATGTPADPTRFVGRCLQGAAAATEHEVPGVAVHVLRDEDREGPVAWLTQTGLLSGYGVLFAVGYAQLHDLPVTLIEPPGGTLEPRSPDARDEAMDIVATTGVPVTRLTDPSPLDRVLRDAYSVVVHPVLDAPDRRALLHRDELSAAATAEGNPAAAVRLVREFPGDVVVVLDGVRLLEGESHLAASIAGVVLGAVAVAGVGTALAPAASAATLGTGQATTATANQDTLAGVTVTATGRNGTAHTGTFHVTNRLTEPVTLTLQAVWTHSGNHPDIVVTGGTVTVAPGATHDAVFDAPRPTGVTGQGGYHISGPAQSWNIVVTDSHGHVLTTIHTTPGGQLPPVVETHQVPVTQLVPQYHQQTPPQPTITPQVPTAIPTAIPTATPDPTLPPQLVPQLPPTQTPQQVPTAIPTATPDPTLPPQLVPQLPPTQTPTQVPTATPDRTPDPLLPPQLVPQLTPTEIPTIVEPGEVTEVTEVTVHVRTPETTTTVTTPGTTHETTHETTGTPGLAHTGATNTGLLAGLAAALVAAGAGMTVLGRRRPQADDEGAAE